MFRPKTALTAIRKKMINTNPHVALYALLVKYNSKFIESEKNIDCHFYGY